MFELIVILSLLGLGYGFGSYREKSHYASIFRREEELREVGLKLPAGWDLFDEDDF